MLNDKPYTPSTLYRLTGDVHYCAISYATAATGAADRAERARATVHAEVQNGPRSRAARTAADAAAYYAGQAATAAARARAEAWSAVDRGASAALIDSGRKALRTAEAAAARAAASADTAAATAWANWTAPATVDA